MIVGPSETPYFGGFYFFEFKYPGDYPHSPPEVIYKTNGDNIRFNPNLYVNGKVCISLLNTWRGEQWTSCQTITTVLLNLCLFLLVFLSRMNAAADALFFSSSDSISDSSLTGNPIGDASGLSTS